MSEENVEIVRGIFRSWNERRGAETARFFDEEIEFDATALPQPDINRVYRGRQELGSWLREWLSAWEHLDAEPIWVESQGERVVAWLHMRMIGKQSGVPVEENGGWGFTFRDGQIIHVRLFADEAEALEAAGLSE